MTAGDSYRFVHFSEAETVSERDVIELWGPAVAEPLERLRELAIVALTPTGELAAVTTVYLTETPRLRMELWHMRTFVAEAHRQAELAKDIAKATIEYLEERFVSGHDRRGAGVFVEVENPVLKAIPWAVWRRTLMAYLGEDAEGNQLRVRYFPGAQAPLPG